MDLTVLSKLTTAELQKIGRDMKLETPVGLRKQELIAKILEGQARQNGAIYDEGVLEILPDGFGVGEDAEADALERAETLSKDCDVMLVVGTSGIVYPAALMPRFANEAGATVVDVNPERDALTANATIFLKGPGGEVLPLLLAAVREHLGD